MKYTRQTTVHHERNSGRLFLICACLSLLLCFDAGAANAESAASNADKRNGPTLRADSRELAKTFIRDLTEIPVHDIGALTLLYDVHMDVGWNVKVKMNATLEMKKGGSGYVAIFRLSEPVGGNLWSRFALSIFGEHTSQYKEMMRSVETRLEERFHLKDGRFLTEELKEILPATKKYENQSGIRVHFEYDAKSIRFWEDQTTAEFNQSLEYTSQVGPMTGFFNFLFFEKPQTDLNIINALKRVEDPEAAGAASSQEKKVRFVFSSERVTLHRNHTGRHEEYANAVSFQTDNFLDIIYGKNIYFDLLHDHTHNLKVPYAIHLDGIISKTKRRKKELRIEQLMRRRRDSRAYEEELEAIQAMDDLAARNVAVLLSGVNVDGM